MWAEQPGNPKAKVEWSRDGEPGIRAAFGAYTVSE